MGNRQADLVPHGHRHNETVPPSLRFAWQIFHRRHIYYAPRPLAICHVKEGASFPQETVPINSCPLGCIIIRLAFKLCILIVCNTLLLFFASYCPWFESLYTCDMLPFSPINLSTQMYISNMTGGGPPMIFIKSSHAHCHTHPLFPTFPLSCTLVNRPLR